MMNFRIVFHHERIIQGRSEQRPYAVVPDIESLPSRITALYRRLTAGAVATLSEARLGQQGEIWTGQLILFGP